MKCADHPDRDAVAILKCDSYKSYFGVCDECYKLHKRNTDEINMCKD